MDITSCNSTTIESYGEECDDGIHDAMMGFTKLRMDYVEIRLPAVFLPI